MGNQCSQEEHASSSHPHDSLHGDTAQGDTISSFDLDQARVTLSDISWRVIKEIPRPHPYKVLDHWEFIF